MWDQLVREEPVRPAEIRSLEREAELRLRLHSPGRVKETRGGDDARHAAARQDEDVVVSHEDTLSFDLVCDDLSEEEERPAKRQRGNEEGERSKPVGMGSAGATSLPVLEIPTAPRATSSLPGYAALGTSEATIHTLPSGDTPPSPTADTRLTAREIAADPRLQPGSGRPEIAAASLVVTKSSTPRLTGSNRVPIGIEGRNDQLGTPSPSPRALGGQMSLEASVDLSPWAGHFPLSSNPMNTLPVDLGPFPRYVGVNGDHKLIIARDAASIERIDATAKIVSVDQLDEAALDQLGIERVNTYRWKVSREIRVLYDVNQECLALGPKRASDRRSLGK